MFTFSIVYVILTLVNYVRLSCIKIKVEFIIIIIIIICFVSFTLATQAWLIDSNTIYSSPANTSSLTLIQSFPTMSSLPSPPVAPPVTSEGEEWCRPLIGVTSLTCSSAMRIHQSETPPPIMLVCSLWFFNWQHSLITMPDVLNCWRKSLLCRILALISRSLMRLVIFNSICEYRWLCGRNPWTLVCQVCEY